MRRDIRVLIVEDEPLVGEMIQRTLDDMGYMVVGKAVDGLQAIELTQTLQPDVVLMDLEMPKMGGIEATRCIHASCPTPVVILSAYEAQDLVEKASQAGAGAYLIKPPDMREVERAITIAMARFDDMMELRRLNSALERFTNTVSHDLKSPLIIITGFLDLLEQDIKAGNVEQMQIRDSLNLIRDRMVAALTQLAERAAEHAETVMVGRSHNVPAQATTLGKRFANSGQELLVAFERIEDLIARYPLRGIKGPVGTQQDQLDLLSGDEGSLERLEEAVASHLEFSAVLDNVGQVAASAALATVS